MDVLSLASAMSRHRLHEQLGANSPTQISKMHGTVRDFGQVQVGQSSSGIGVAVFVGLLSAMRDCELERSLDTKLSPRKTFLFDANRFVFNITGSSMARLYYFLKLAVCTARRNLVLCTGPHSSTSAFYSVALGFCARLPQVEVSVRDYICLDRSELLPPQSSWRKGVARQAFTKALLKCLVTRNCGENTIIQDKWLYVFNAVSCWTDRIGLWQGCDHDLFPLQTNETCTMRLCTKPFQASCWCWRSVSSSVLRIRLRILLLSQLFLHSFPNNHSFLHGSQRFSEAITLASCFSIGASYSSSFQELTFSGMKMDAGIFLHEDTFLQRMFHSQKLSARSVLRMSYGLSFVLPAIARSLPKQHAGRRKLLFAMIFVATIDVECKQIGQSWYIVRPAEACTFFHRSIVALFELIGVTRRNVGSIPLLLKIVRSAIRTLLNPLGVKSEAYFSVSAKALFAIISRVCGQASDMKIRWRVVKAGAKTIKLFGAYINTT